MIPRHSISFSLGAFLLFLLVTNLQSPSQAQEKSPEPTQKTEEKDPKKEEKPKERSGQISLGGTEIKYLAQTGTIPVFKDDGAVKADVFYVYYAATGPNGKRLSTHPGNSRPITFCFNGGPGASAVWLHLGGLGPRRLDFPPEGLSPSTVCRIVDNPNSILDATDLVFVDPVSTGLSRAAKGEKPEQFFGIDEDIAAVGEFVRLFTTREQRWTSPKFFLGESYGATRVSGLVGYLQQKHGLFADGLILMSGLINFGTLNADAGNDLPFILYLPTLTATAHYHKKLSPDLLGNLDQTIAESRRFAQTDYALALLKGATLPIEDRRSIASKLARFTGLNAEQILEQNLRIDPAFFRKALLKSEGKIIGRFDARVTGEDGDPGDPLPAYDPSFSNIVGGFASAVNAYIRTELNFESDHPYHVLNGVPWKWSAFEGRYVSTEDRLAYALRTNPRMRVLILAGRRDLAVPEDSMRYSLDHLTLPASVRKNISTSLYESGHMMYLLRSDAEKLRADLLRFLK